MTDIAKLIDSYAEGPRLLREALAPADESMGDATPVAGKWSLRQLVCHLADSEIMFVDRMRRVIAEDRPLFADYDQNRHLEGLTRTAPAMAMELALIESLRVHMTAVLWSLDEADFERAGVHPDEGPVTLRTLLERVTGHIPHHLPFIEEKLRALAGS